MVETDKRCKECKKDWTKCGTCPVMMEGLDVHKINVEGMKIRAKSEDKE